MQVMSETYQRAMSDTQIEYGFKPEFTLNEFEREAIATIGRLRGSNRESEACIGRVLKQIAQERIQAEGKR